MPASPPDSRWLTPAEVGPLPAGFAGRVLALLVTCVGLNAAGLRADGLPAKPPEAASGATNPATPAALEKLRFPGVNINVEERCVDLEGAVCLHRGALELVACSKGTKEHESIVAIAAKPMHVHAALLLLGAKPGSPATREPLGDPPVRWLDVPPKGGPVDVFLVLQGDGGKWVEHPISAFIVPARSRSGDAAEGNPKHRFPTDTFVFAGSVLQDNGPGPRRYLCDQSGNLISLSTFGDEVLCLPAIHSQENEALPWQVDPTLLPPVGSNVILRLRPQPVPTAKPPKSNPSTPTPGPEGVQSRPIP